MACGQHDPHRAFAEHAFDSIFIADQGADRHTTGIADHLAGSDHGEGAMGPHHRAALEAAARAHVTDYLTQ